MNASLSRFALFFPALLTVLATGVAVPHSEAQCCGGSSGAFPGGSVANPHGTLQQIFGGSSSRVIALKNKSNATVTYQLGGRKVTLGPSNGSGLPPEKRVDMGGSDPATATVAPLPGETSTASVKNDSGTPGTNNTVEEKEETTCPPPYVFDGSDGVTGAVEAETARDIPVPPSPTDPTQQAPPKESPAPNKGAENPPAPPQEDNNDTGHGGAALSPGAASLDSSGSQVRSQPGVMIAASLGAAGAGHVGRLGYIIPAATGTGSVYQFHERGSYTVRGVDLSSTTATVGSGVGGETRVHTVSNGLALLKQTSADILEFKFYATGAYSTSSPYNPNGGATPFRTMKVERLTTGNPNSSKYNRGAKVTIIRPGRNDEWKTMWWSDLTAAGAGSLNGDLFSALTSWSTGITVETSSDATYPTRSVLTTTSETFTDASGTSKTLKNHTKDVLEMRADGQELVTSHTVYLTDNTATGAPSVTTTYDYWPANADAYNRNSLRFQSEADGSWAAYSSREYPVSGGLKFKESTVVRGWKDQSAPVPSTLTDSAAVLNLAYAEGYRSTIVVTDTRGRMASEVEYTNGVQTAYRYEHAKTTTYPNVGAVAYPFCSLVSEMASASGPWRDVLTYSVGWSAGNPAALTADSVIPILRNRPKDVYRFKDRTGSAANPTAAITAANVISRTHYRYLSGTATTGFPAYSASGSYSNSDPFEITDRLEDVTHLPTLMHRTVTNRLTGDVIGTEKWMVTAVNSTTGDPTAAEVLQREGTVYDDRGRPTRLLRDGMIVGTWFYTNDTEMISGSSDGSYYITRWSPSGRVIHSIKAEVAASSFGSGGSVPAQSAIWTSYTYNLLANTNAPKGLYEVSTAMSAKGGTNETAAVILDGSSIPWTRTTVDYYDGVGRKVYTKDVLNTENTIAYPTDQAPAATVSRYLGANTSGALLERTESFTDGQFKARSGVAVVEEYADYTVAAFAFSSWRSPYPASAGGGYTSVTNSLGQLTSGSQSIPVGSSYPQTSDVWTPAGTGGSYTTYDDSGNLTARKMPLGNSVDYFAVAQFDHPTTYGANRTATRALSSDAAYDTSDPNQSRTRRRYEKTGSIWYAVTERQYGSSWLTESYTKKALGPFTGATGTWDGLTYNLVSLSITNEGGALRQTSAYVAVPSNPTSPYPGKTLVQTLLDGAVERTIFSRAGLALFFQTPRFQRTLTYSPLADPLNETLADSAFWPILTVATATGRVVSMFSPTSEIQNSYIYYTGNDTRSGLLRVKPSFYSGSTTLTYYSYNDRGQLTHQWGNGESPARYTYDAQGRMTGLDTWRTGTWTSSTWPASPPTPDTTSWSYHDWLSKPSLKTYMPGPGEAATRRSVTYLYNPDGSLQYREWQRTDTGSGSSGIPTFYTYDAVGRLDWVGYPITASAMASATPWVNHTYDSAGRLATRREVGFDSMSNPFDMLKTTYTWTFWGGPSKETIDVSLPGITGVTAEVERTFDSSNRPDLLKAKWGTGSGMTAPDVDHGFDSSGNLSTVASAGRTVTATRATGTLQWGTLTFNVGASTLLTATRTLDTAGRTGSISYSQSSTLFQSFNYSYDRDRVTKLVRDQGASGDELAWDYGYDSKGRVTSADKRFHASGSFTGNYLAGHQTDYAYDEAGNRASKREGGDDTSTHNTGTRQTTYSTNALNQYTTINNPVDGSGKQQFEVMGRRGSSSETIQINGTTIPSGGATDSYQPNSSGLHYWKRVDHTAPTTPANVGTYESVTVNRTAPSPTVTLEQGQQFLPHPTENPGVDADGNLRFDTRHTFEWDAENRLTKILTRHPATTTTPGTRLTFGYDCSSRRLWKKTETTTNGTSWTILNHEAYLYDGWNLIMRVTLNSSGTATARQSFVWGPDISSRATGHSSWQSAGGVGGLLMVLDTVGSTSSGDNFFALMDRMGNVTGYRRANAGAAAQLSAVYEYDAFGRELRSVGEIIPGSSPAAVFNPDSLPFHFSTKFTDGESGMIYYGYRYYDPINGRWTNRDPIEETGGLNLTAFVNNNSPSLFDYLGLYGGSGANSNEKAWCIANPICCANAKNSGAEVKAEMQNRYPNWQDNTVENAVQHCAWMCYVATLPCCGKQSAISLGYAHEQTPGNPKHDKAMDYHNNNVGANMNGKDLKDCFDKCEQAAKDHKLYWWKGVTGTPPRQGLPSDFPGTSIDEEGVPSSGTPGSASPTPPPTPGLPQTIPQRNRGRIPNPALQKPAPAARSSSWRPVPEEIAHPLSIRQVIVLNIFMKKNLIYAVLLMLFAGVAGFLIGKYTERNRNAELLQYEDKSTTFVFIGKGGVANQVDIQLLDANGAPVAGSVIDVRNHSGGNRGIADEKGRTSIPVGEPEILHILLDERLVFERTDAFRSEYDATQGLRVLIVKNHRSRG